MKCTVPRYFFVVRCPHFEVRDFKGVELSSEADARDYAARLVKELLHEKSDKGRGFEISVRDDDRQVLFVEPFENSHLHYLGDIGLEGAANYGLPSASIPRRG
jgi:hypothetical protein